MENITYVSPLIEVIDMELEGSILTASSADVSVRDWEDEEIC